jgi:hypothetical protein
MLSSLTHHLNALLVIVCSVRWITVLGFTGAILLSISVRSINTHKGLSLGLEHIKSSIFVPTIDEIAMQAVTIANLSKPMLSVFVGATRQG